MKRIVEKSNESIDRVLLSVEWLIQTNNKINELDNFFYDEPVFYNEEDKIEYDIVKSSFDELKRIFKDAEENFECGYDVLNIVDTIAFYLKEIDIYVNLNNNFL